METRRLVEVRFATTVFVRVVVVVHVRVLSPAVCFGFSGWGIFMAFF